ncbi:MAG TPA: bifunctional phosphoglucose/phosphomannose isomerase [Miltoncostaeaceae bacterium]|nr:bifunctional phosphoglucose/phosphomannose isomerase [Miltoncostaeaceae bacterium]
MSTTAALDAAALYARDSLGLVADMARSVEAFDEARAGAQAADLVWPPEAVRNVAICGMGGSAIAGDLVTGAYRERLRMPVAVLRDYYVPGWLGEDTLVILSSYSGETEETLTAASQAIERNALCVAITSGGKLGTFYREQGVPVIDLPPGLQPRAALLRLLVPLVVVLSRFGVIPPADAELDDARDAVERGVEALGPRVPQEVNPAKALAEQLLGTLPIFWGAEATAAVAQRWKGQVNENAKAPAYWGILPEVDHNEICGFEGMGALGPETRLVLLRDDRHHRQVIRRFELTRELVEPHVGGVHEVTAEGRTALGRALDLVMAGDYTSLYLGLLRGVDPGPVEMIGRLKGRLADTGYGRAQAPR